VQRTAKLLNLEIDMRSVYGKGSKFSIGFKPSTVQAPPSLITQQVIKKEIDFDLNGVSVLVVDDEANILDALEILLKDWGCNVITCKTIQQVKDTLEEFHPDILLTDYRLKNNETGNMVIKEVRQATGFETPCIVITGTVASRSLSRIQSRYTKLLYKPLQPKELREEMVAVLNL